MKEYGVIMSGFGGQGILFMGDLLAFCGMREGYHVTWMPSYGVEMRGGAASCTVVISEEEIGSPVVGSPEALIAMSGPALDRYCSRLAPGGLLVVDGSLIGAEDLRREDVRPVLVPAREVAGESGDLRMANAVMLGVFLEASGLLPPERAVALLPSFLPESKSGLGEAFGRALLAGAGLIPRAER